MKYKYNQDIEKQLQTFEKYLKSKKYAIDTIRQTRNYAGIFLEWLEQEGKKVEHIEYEEMTDFIFQLKKDERPISEGVKYGSASRERTAKAGGRHYSTNQIKRIILAVRHYYESLNLDRNPASGIHMRGSRKSIINDIIPYAELIELYNSYQILDDRSRRNKVILSILIYQGITTGELQKLEPGHIKLKEGKIYIPGHGKSNSRILKLEANQLLELQEYLLVVRPRMLDNVKAHRPGRKPIKINPRIREKLFFSERGDSNIKQSLYHMFRAIKKSNPRVSSGKIIRSTVIVEWLKTRDIRIVQYMAGHRYVSSTERYQIANMKELKESLKKHHPLKWR